MLINSINHTEAEKIIRNLTFSQMDIYKDNNKELLKITIVTLGIGLMLRDRSQPIDEIERDVYDSFESLSKKAGNTVLTLSKWGSKVIESFDYGSKG